MKKLLHKDDEAIDSSEFSNLQKFWVGVYGEDFFKHLSPQGFFFGVSGKGSEIHKTSLANDPDSKAASSTSQKDDVHSNA